VIDLSNFAKRLKKLRIKNKILQKDISTDLGVAQTTISNYEKGVRFPDEATLKTIASYFNVTIDYLLGYAPENDTFSTYKNQPILESNILTNPTTLTLLAQRYMNYLMEGKSEEARTLLVDAVNRGEDLKSIYINIFERTLVEIGTLWNSSRIDVFQEHYFTEATQMIMSQVNALRPRSESKDYAMISLSTGGELHNIGIRMVTDFMAMDGWKTYFLGSNVPSESLIKAADYYHADVIAISCTMSYHVNSVLSLIKTIHSSHLIKKPKIIVGGLAFNYDKLLWKRVQADGYACSASECVELANKLVK
jgi:methanogenic corrinoid protein MtbC1